MREQHTEEEEFTEKMQKIQQIGKEVKRGDFNFLLRVLTASVV